MLYGICFGYMKLIQKMNQIHKNEVLSGEIMIRLTERNKYTGKAILKKLPNYYEYNLIERLAYYEDMEEQGRLLIIPCEVGDTLYDIYEAVNNKGFEDGVIKELKVSEIHINLDKRNRPWLIISNYMFAFEDFGKTVFLSKEEAEEALRN